MTDAENLRTRRSAIITELAALTSSSPGGGMNHSAMGRSFDHVGYKRSLYEELEQINALLGALEDDGPWEIEQQGIP